MLDAQPSLVRSPTTFRTADGNLFGFEGGLGASTLNWNGMAGGSCPLTCTHVWNYEQALARIFPALERTMRDVELDVTQAPEGYLPHRVVLPLWMPQLHGVGIGGPERPALDGMLGAPLKALRELRQGAGVDWLRSRWDAPPAPDVVRDRDLGSAGDGRADAATSRSRTTSRCRARTCSSAASGWRRCGRWRS